MRIARPVLIAVCLSLALLAPAAAADPTATSTPAAKAPATDTPAPFLTDYNAAYRLAQRDRKMLVLLLHHAQQDDAWRRFEAVLQSDAKIQQALDRSVVVRLPIDAPIAVGDRQLRLAEHPSFAEMQGRQGVAILDLAHSEAEYYRHLVSVYPFTPGRHIRKRSLQALLELPPGTLTQRTLTFVVRNYSDRAQSADGNDRRLPLLCDEAYSHSQHQASIRLQGHHNWDSRFHQINARLPAGLTAVEVCAESWPGQSLLDAARECVYSWRRSAGHWRNVSARHAFYGYDMRRGGNGVWYATGIFAR